jgi:hypothetical protein
MAAESGHERSNRVENDYYSEARRQLVERRTGLIKALARAYHDEQMEAHIDLILRLQSVIDVIDRVAAAEAGPQ